MMANFPWEMVFRHLIPHPRSLILMHMVDKGLAWRLRSDHAIWVQVFRRHIFRHTNLDRPVAQTRYPHLKLSKSSLTGIPVHTGLIRGDPTATDLPPTFDSDFTAYARKAFALMFGQRCGMCGCRWHHEPYWPLGMRVCKLCMAGNLMSSWELLDRYGTHYADISRLIGNGRVFYFFQEFGAKQDRLPPHSSTPADISNRRNMWVFWRPHLAKVIDLPALYTLQKQRKAAASLLSGVARRARVLALRRGIAGRDGERRWLSIDRLVMELYRDERRANLTVPWRNYRTDYPSIGGPDWAFVGSPGCKVCRHERFHRESRGALSTFMFRWEDSGPFTLPDEDPPEPYGMPRI